MEQTQLTEQVKISLEDAKSSIREALAFSAKSETPQVNMAISQLLYGVDQVLNYYERSKSPFEEIMRKHFEGH